MPRKLSPLALQSALAQETGEAWLFLVEISHKALAAPLRWVNNTEEVTSNGNKFVPFPFSLELSIDDEQHIPEVRMMIDNVDRQLIELVRTEDTPPTFRVMVVLASQPDTIEVEVVGLRFLEVSYDAYYLQGTLIIDDLLTTRYPADVISIASGYQGLFKQ